MIARLIVLFIVVPAFGWGQNFVSPCVGVSDHNAPKSTEITHRIDYHRLDLAVDPAVHYIAGSVTTYFTSLKDGLTSIRFDLSSDLVISGIEANGTGLIYTHANDVVIVTLPLLMNTGDRDSLTISYSGIPQSSGYGSFETAQHAGVPIMWTQSQPYGAKDWWPCQEGLFNKIDSIDLLIRVPTGNVVASNGVLRAHTSNGTQDVYHWEHRYPIANYLIAFSVTNYVVQYDNVQLSTGAVVPIENYVYPETATYWLQVADHTKEAMIYFSTLFGEYPFKLEKYGHAQYSASGGMEHQTMSFMSGPSKPLISHELAHQWFGNKVTCGSWRDLWLNEGFATYMEGLMHEQIDQQQWYNFLQNTITSVTSLNGGSTYVSDTVNVGLLFDYRLVYQKGAMLLHMLRWELGNELFFSGLGEYLYTPDLIHDFAVTSDFQSAMEFVSGRDLEEFFQDWFYGQGFPTHHVFAVQEGGRIKLQIQQSQSHPSVSLFELTLPIRFFNEAQDTVLRVPITSNYSLLEMDIPFIATGAEIDPYYWLISKNNTIDFKRRTILTELYPNPGQGLITVNSSKHIERLEISDTRGRIAYSAFPDALLTTFDSSKFASGNYEVRVFYEDGSVESLSYLRQ